MFNVASSRDYYQKKKLGEKYDGIGFIYPI